MSWTADVAISTIAMQGSLTVAESDAPRTSAGLSVSAVLPTVTARAAAVVAAELATSMPYEAAAAWVHTGAVVQHAIAVGLVDDQGGLVETLRALAEAHPALAGLGVGVAVDVSR